MSAADGSKPSWSGVGDLFREAGAELAERNVGEARLSLDEARAELDRITGGRVSLLLDLERQYRVAKAKVSKGGAR